MATAKQNCAKLIEKNPWIRQEKDFFNIVDSKYHFDKMKISDKRKELERIIQENESL